MKKSYTLKDFAEACTRKTPVDTLVPLFTLIWQEVDDSFREGQFSWASMATFAGRGGHRGHGLWECVISGLLVSVTPIYTDIDIVSSGTIYMVWRVEIEADTEDAIDTVLSKLAFLFKKYAADKKQFHPLYLRGVELMGQYRPDVLSPDMRRFYNLGI